MRKSDLDAYMDYYNDQVVKAIKGELTMDEVSQNMKKYREGERLREGPYLESITPQGIILQHNGQRFILNQD